MTRPLLPPYGIEQPTSLLFNKDIPAAVKETWCQLKALAWGLEETPPFSAKQFEELTGKCQRTLYGHMRVLQHLNALQWRQGGNATFIVYEFMSDRTECQSSTVLQESANCKNLQLPDHINTPSKDSTEEKEKFVLQESAKLQKLAKPDQKHAEKPPPRHDAIFEAVAEATRRTPPGKDWSLMPAITRGIFNKVAGELRKVKATPEQIMAFPEWFETQKKGNYKLRRPIEPWDLPKMWTQFLGDQNGLSTGNGGKNQTGGSGTYASGIAARVAAIQRAAAERAGQGVPALPLDADTRPD